MFGLVGQPRNLAAHLLFSPAPSLPLVLCSLCLTVFPCHEKGSRYTLYLQPQCTLDTAAGRSSSSPVDLQRARGAHDESRGSFCQARPQGPTAQRVDVPFSAGAALSALTMGLDSSLGPESQSQPIPPGRASPLRVEPGAPVARTLPVYRYATSR